MMRNLPVPVKGKLLSIKLWRSNLSQSGLLKTTVSACLSSKLILFTEDEIDAMFDFADKDRDGKINYRFN